MLNQKTMNPIQSLIDAVEKQISHTIDFEGHSVMVSWNLFDFDLWHIWIDRDIIHSTKRNGIKKILKEWLDDKRYFCKIEDSTPLLIKK